MIWKLNIPLKDNKLTEYHKKEFNRYSELLSYIQDILTGKIIDNFPVQIEEFVFNEEFYNVSEEEYLLKYSTEGIDYFNDYKLKRNTIFNNLIDSVFNSFVTKLK
jgi:hypothetical protein